MDESKQPGLRIGQIFLARALFEHRKDVLALPPSTSIGEIRINVNIRIGATVDGSKGIVIVSVHTINEDDPIYRFTVEMIGHVEQDKEDKNLDVREYLATFGAPTLYPFLRETVANLTGRGRFGPLWLKPINFNAVERIQTFQEVATGPEQAPQQETPGPE